MDLGYTNGELEGDWLQAGQGLGIVWVWALSLHLSSLLHIAHVMEELSCCLDSVPLGTLREMERTPVGLGRNSIKEMKTGGWESI